MDGMFGIFRFRTVLAVLCGFALVVVGSSPGQFDQPSLRLSPDQDRTRIFLTALDPATARLEVFAPPGYRITLGQAPGSTIGTSSLQFSALPTLGAIAGTLTAVDPDSVAPAAEACTGRATHEAAWLVRSGDPGPAFELPVFLDRIAAGPASEFASLQIQACPPSDPALRFSFLGLSVFGNAKVLDPPTGVGEYRWTALFRSSDGGVLESQVVEHRPQSISLTARTVSRTIVVRRNGKHRVVKRLFARVQGRVLAAQEPVVGASVRLRATPAVHIRWNPLYSSYDGRFSETIPIVFTTVFQAEAGGFPWLTWYECQPLIGQRCTSVTDADFAVTSPTATARVGKR